MKYDHPQALGEMTPYYNGAAGNVPQQTEKLLIVHNIIFLVFLTNTDLVLTLRLFCGHYFCIHSPLYTTTIGVRMAFPCKLCRADTNRLWNLWYLRSYNFKQCQIARDVPSIPHNIWSYLWSLHLFPDRLLIFSNTSLQCLNSFLRKDKRRKSRGAQEAGEELRGVLAASQIFNCCWQFCLVW